MSIIGIIIGILISTVFAGIVIWIVAKLNLGLEVSGFGGAFLAALVIAIIWAIIVWIWGLLGYSPGAGLGGAVVNLITAAIVIYFAGSFVPGFKAKGYTGAFIAAIAIAVINWLIAWGLSLVIK